MKTWRSWPTIVFGVAAVVILGLATVIVISAREEAPTVPPAQGRALGVPPVAPPPSGPAGVGKPEAQVRCTKQVTDSAAMEQAVTAALPGDRICISGNMGAARLEVTRSGTPDRPIVILGGGKAITQGVTVHANHVVVDGVIAQQPTAPGISIKGTDITVKNSSSISPRGGDGDGLRFWGNDLQILHNTIRDTRGRKERHADCMQTFATDDDHPASQNVLIDSNRCADIDNICLIAEGPDSEAGDGSGRGHSRHIVFSNNYCENGAAQALFIDDVTDVQVIGNSIVGRVDKAFAFQNGSTGAKVARNKIAPHIRYEVGIDDSSEKGYQGPAPGGKP